MRDAVLFCRVNSWLTGRRMVSLPYSDHCEPLAETGLVHEICALLDREVRERRLRYFELRPLHHLAPRDTFCRPMSRYYLHLLDLTPDLDAIHGGFHHSSIQRKIRRAAREGLKYREGRSEDLLRAFRRLQAMTRRRHGVPAQPALWFQNLIRFFGDALKIRVAIAGDEAATAILTIQHKDTLVYKYGCGDTRLNRLGGMQMLLWKAIEDAKAHDLKVFDLGRSDTGQDGLVKFKERWGCETMTLTYLHCTGTSGSEADETLSEKGWKMRMAGRIIGRVPSRLLTPINRFLYKHGA